MLKKFSTIKSFLLILLTLFISSCGDSSVEVDNLKFAILEVTSDNNFTFDKTLKTKKRYKEITITNIGDKEATELSLSISGATSEINFAGGSYPGTPNVSDPSNLSGATIPGAGTCSTTLAVNASCTLVFEFAPFDNNNFSIDINASYNNFFETITLNNSINAQGADEARIEISYESSTNFVNFLGTHPTYFANVGSAGFDALGTPNTRGEMFVIFAVQNTGEWPADTLSYNIPNLPPISSDIYTITGNDCNAILAEGERCYITVRFSPNALSFFN